MDQKSKSSQPKTGAKQATGSLYVVATPIGNLADLTYRAVATLKAADLLACEDTRTSRVLCEHYSITTPRTPYHEHNATEALPRLLARIEAGESVALISDAGTPLISDPGYRLVREASQRGITIIPIPGPSSTIAALSAAGLPSDAFHFAGFLPSKQQARRDALHRLAGIPATLILFESNRRLPATLADAAALLGERRAVVARELTKRFEEFRRDTLSGLAACYAENTDIKGELVLLIAPPEHPATPALADITPLMQALLAHYPVKQAASLLADVSGISRKTLYQHALTLNNHRDD